MYPPADERVCEICGPPLDGKVFAKATRARKLPAGRPLQLPMPGIESMRKFGRARPGQQQRRDQRPMDRLDVDRVISTVPPELPDGGRMSEPMTATFSADHGPHRELAEANAPRRPTG